MYPDETSRQRNSRDGRPVEAGFSQNGHGPRPSPPSNGVDSSAAAGPSRLAEQMTPHRLDSPTQGKPRPKRRRLDAELAFSSPGPAFQTQLSTTDEEDRDASGHEGRSSRATRNRRSMTHTNGHDTAVGTARGSGKKRSVSSSELHNPSASSGSTIAEGEDFSARNRPNGSASHTKQTSSIIISIPKTSFPRPHSVGATSLVPPREPEVARSRSGSACSTTQMSDDAFDDILDLPLITPTREKPKITPVDALTGQRPFPEILAKRKEEKTALVQSDLEDVHEHHDLLVRELFHLTKFVTMVGYDPDVARKDQSDVFTTFQQAHDLRFALDADAAASTSGRTTRRRVNARLESLSLSRALPPPPSPKVNDSTHTGKRGRKSSNFADNRESLPPTSKSGAVDIFDDDDRDLGQQQKKGRTREISDEDNDLEVSASAKAKRKGRKSKILDNLDDFILRHQPRSLPDKPPPLHVLSPHQVPILRQFGGNFDAYWQSFGLLHEDIVSAISAKEMEKRELEAYLRVDRSKRAGVEVNNNIAASARLSAQQFSRKKTHHDHLLEAVSFGYDTMRRETRAKRQLAKKVSRMIAQHWERQIGSSERDRKAEEKRVRALAKWTIREVAKQWRLAVNVVKARKAAIEKAEKEKLDKQQLNAILEKSTAMLKKQHQEMARIDDDSEPQSDSERSVLDDSDEDGTLSDEDDGDISQDGSDNDSDISEEEADSIAPTSLMAGEDDDQGLTGSETPDVFVAADSVLGSPELSANVSVQDEDMAVFEDAEPTVPVARRLRAVQDAPVSALSEKTDDPDLNDVEFSAVGDEDNQEDLELDRAMLEEDETDDSEDAGLAADADIPLEELLKRYRTEANEGAEAAPDSGDAKSDSVMARTDTLTPDAADMDESDAGIQIAAEEDHSSSADASQDLVVQDHSDSESAATSSRRSKSQSVTGASSVVTNDRHATRSRQPFLLRGQLRPYQQIGYEWLAGLYANGVNGILADEMGLGKTIQTISVLAHLACDKGVWGPHLVVAPTSVMLNWEVEFKKFLPGFKILSYYGNQRERKEKRVGWNTENSFNVCITSYQLVLADQHIFRRKPWVYLVLDEAHHIKNFRSQRWQTLLGFNSQRRLLLTGTPLQNNLMDLWSLMYFLMPHGDADLQGGGAFANMKDFQDWFSNPLDKAIEGGSSMNEETRAMVTKLHTVLRPFLLRRLKSEVEKELPSKYEHVITCRLSKRQRFLYNDFMSRARTRESLASGNYLSIINCLMQLRKVCNHPDLFEVRPIVTSFAMQRSAVADFEIKELLVRKKLLHEASDVPKVNLGVVNLRITDTEQHLTAIESRDLRKLNAAKKLPFFRESVPTPPELDTWTIDGFVKTREQRSKVEKMEHWKHLAYLNQYRCTKKPIYGSGLISLLQQAGKSKVLLPLENYEADRQSHLDRCDNLLRVVKSYATRRTEMQPTIDRFAFATPRAVATDMPRWALAGFEPHQCPAITKPEFDTVHPVAVKLHIAFPDASLLQYDCGKLQQLNILMRRLKEGGHRILIFTQMTRVLDILESFLNFHGYKYLRLDGATKVEQRQALTEKFNRDLRISAFILSTRSGGLGINLTGADTVLFYDLDWNAAIEAQCMDRAHRIGQTRDVHIYRFVTEHTIEENMLRKANQKRLLDSMVIQEGEFNTDALAKKIDWRDMLDEGGKLGDVEVGFAENVAGGVAAGAREVEKAFLDAEDEEDRQAALVARQEMFVDDSDFTEQQPPTADKAGQGVGVQNGDDSVAAAVTAGADQSVALDGDDEEEEEEGGTVDDYMLAFVERDWEYFA